MRLSIFEEFYHITYFIHVFFESNFYEQKKCTNCIFILAVKMIRVPVAEICNIRVIFWRERVEM